MSANILHMDSANLFAGDDDPNNSQFLVIKDITLPSLEETVKDHTGGGAAMSIEIGMRVIEKLMLRFKLEGFQPEVSNKFMPLTGRTKYTVRGNIRDIRDHTELGVEAIVEGRMTKVEVSEFDREKGVDTDYEIKEILFYQVLLGGQEKFYFDYFSGPAGVRVDGNLVFAAQARNLGLA